MLMIGGYSDSRVVLENGQPHSQKAIISNLNASDQRSCEAYLSVRLFKTEC